MTYTIHQAKTQLSKLIHLAQAGEEVIIARGKNPVVSLVPTTTAGRRIANRNAGKIIISPDFDEPLAELRDYLPE